MACHTLEFTEKRKFHSEQYCRLNVSNKIDHCFLCNKLLPKNARLEQYHFFTLDLPHFLV